MEDRMNNDRSTDEGGGTRVYATEKEIKAEVPNIMRIVEPNAYQKYWRMWPVCDDGKKRPFIVKNEHEGESTLLKMLGDSANYYRGGFLESRKADGGSKYFVYEKAAPELFLLIAKNGNPRGDNGSWKPSKEFAFNIIDRDVDYTEAKAPYNWCNTNKHTKLLRMKTTAFDSLVDTRDNDGPLDEYDVNYTKKGKGTDTVHSIRKAGAQFPTAVQGLLTAEEIAYDKYDLKYETRLASATYILKYLKETIAKVDQVMGTHFVDELMAQSAAEKAQWETDNPEESSEADGAIDTPSAPAPQSAPAQQVAAPSVPPRMRQATQSTSATEVCRGCGATIPAGSEVCPSCKSQLIAPCDACHKMFSTYDTTCPHCGHTY